jgi:hypothetical protein
MLCFQQFDMWALGLPALRFLLGQVVEGAVVLKTRTDIGMTGALLTADTGERPNTWWCVAATAAPRGASTETVALTPR